MTLSLLKCLNAPVCTPTSQLFSNCLLVKQSFHHMRDGCSFPTIQSIRFVRWDRSSLVCNKSTQPSITSGVCKSSNSLYGWG